MRLKRIVLFLVLSLLSFSQVRSEEDVLFNLLKKEFLQGIDKVRVSVRPINKDARDMGLTWDRLITVTELRLRKEGIIVNPQFDCSNIYNRINKELNTPTIYVKVNVMVAHAGGGAVGYVFSINLDILETVILRRDKNVGGAATTLSYSFLGTHAGDPEYIISVLSRLLDQFLNDYYKANPKEKKEVRENEGRA